MEGHIQYVGHLEHKSQWGLSEERRLHVYEGHLEHKSKHGVWWGREGGSLRGEKLT